MEYIKIFEEYSNKKLIHVTSIENAKEISENGFSPIPFIDYKYYSDMGKDGIYFYDNKRLTQEYSYFYKSKLDKDVDKVALIYVESPIEIIESSDKLSDGFFIRTENLSKIKIENIEYKKPVDIY
jgi:hypothetical protein